MEGDKRMSLKPMTPMRAIRARCLDCCAGQANEVRLCPVKRCPLWGYRSGHTKKGMKIPSIDLVGWKPLAKGEEMWK